MSLGQFAWKNLEPRQERGLVGRMDRAGRNKPATLGIELYSAESIGHDRAVDRLGRMTCPPADYVAAQTRLRENVPERFASAGRAGVRPRPAIFRVGLDESVDAVLIGELPGRDRIPKHRGKDRLERGQITHHSSIDQAVECRHQSFFEQRGDDFPIGCIPTD